MTARYDSIAEWYDESVRTGSLIHDLLVPALLEMMGNIEGKQICDFACGQGVLSRLLARLGAQVIGIDLSAKLLDIARRYEVVESLGISYIQGDAQNLPTVEDASFDGVLCNMALMDIPDLERAFTTIARILRPGGSFICSITHPCFQTPFSHWITQEDGTIARAVSDYSNERFWYSDHAAGVRGQVGAHHRTLSTYINTLLTAGLTLVHIAEPQATGEIAQRVPGYGEVPAALILYSRKQ